jgi:putative transposase
MSRLARVVLPGLPHHVTQRGNGRARTFFRDADYALYRDLLARHCAEAGVEVWSWCLMPNHVHLILVPRDADGLRRALAPVHRHYAGALHLRQERSGHFWQGRFGAVAMDAGHCATALVYVALNPVRAGLVARPADWPWASTRALLGGGDDGVTAREPVLARFPQLADMLARGADADAMERLRAAESIGRPLGDARFLEAVERRTGRSLRPARRGPKPGGFEEAQRAWS